LKKRFLNKGTDNESAWNFERLYTWRHSQNPRQLVLSPSWDWWRGIRERGTGGLPERDSYTQSSES